ncbi:ATPase, T2SS/T4P/T4SS family [Marinobacter confluentis]|uniref:FHA domain-containing protein n=1 Tax=Marinobacter confluentis TaxID=1697557 RepID=A0A4Z1BGB7_9GAMM|nr:ATPase, T2SS/T4P/T4SS family [Marinobacter confluentis]TGN41864.1 FHA domain-containing protein [Marinobacter confluentis]
MWLVNIYDSSGNLLQSESLADGRYMIGKSDDCDFPVGDAFVSREHALLSVNGPECAIEDLDSTNGTWLDEEPISGPQVLTEKRRVRLGRRVEMLLKPGTEASRADHTSGAETAPSRQTGAITREAQEKVLEYMNLRKRGDLNKLDYNELRNETRNAAEALIQSGKITLPAGVDREALISDIVSEAIGFGPIEPFLNDDDVTEIMVNGSSQIYIEKAGKLLPTDVSFSSVQSLMNVIERIVSPLGRRIDEGNPMIDARLPDGSRVNAIIPPLALTGPTLTIRKFAKDRLRISDLVRFGSLSEEMAKFLEICVKYRQNIVVSGGTGSGKTTTLNILSDYVSTDERIVTIEDSAELQLTQPHVVSLESRPANVEGKGAVTIRDLVRNSLRMRPDRIVIGECRGGEALDMLQAMNTGHDGSLTTGHANNPRDMLARLETMVLMAGLDLPAKAIREQIASAVQIIVQQMRMSDGKRRIVSIVEVGSWEGDIIGLQEVFRFKQKGIDAQGNVLGVYEGCGYAPSFYQKLSDAGIELDWDIFASENQQEAVIS